jgi:hypothetical protein
MAAEHATQKETVRKGGRMTPAEVQTSFVDKLIIRIERTHKG